MAAGRDSIQPSRGGLGGSDEVAGPLLERAAEVEGTIGTDQALGQAGRPDQEEVPPDGRRASLVEARVDRRGGDDVEAVADITSGAAQPRSPSRASSPKETLNPREPTASGATARAPSAP